LITTEISSSNDEDKNREDAVSEEDADSSWKLLLLLGMPCSNGDYFFTKCEKWFSKPIHT
jgi:hypothetical protein